MKHLSAVVVFVFGALMPSTPAQRIAADGAPQTFAFVSDRFFSDVYFKFSPTGGTAVGLHQYDTQLEDYSAADTQRQIAAVHAAQKRIEAIPSDALDVSVAADREILLADVQFLYLPQFPSKVRKLIGANTNIEGWAHYCEQMMLDEGYLPILTVSPEEQAKLIRLGQLQDALLRDARFIVSIRMHTGVGGPLTIDEAATLFVKEGYQSPSIGSMETKRGTADATYLYYTLGKLEILKLRADVQAKQGAAFNLEAFHTAFMRQGTVSIKVVRNAMLPNDTPVL